MTIKEDIARLKAQSDRLNLSEIDAYLDAACRSLMQTAFGLGIFRSDSVNQRWDSTPVDGALRHLYLADGHDVEKEVGSSLQRLITVSYFPEAIVPIVGQLLVSRYMGQPDERVSVQVIYDGVVRKPAISLCEPNIVVQYTRQAPQLHTLRWEWMSGMKSTVFSYQKGTDPTRLGLGVHDVEHGTTHLLKKLWPKYIEESHIELLKQLSYESGTRLLTFLAQDTLECATQAEFQRYVDTAFDRVIHYFP